MAAAAVALPVGRSRRRFGFHAIFRRCALFHVRHAMLVSAAKARRSSWLGARPTRHHKERMAEPLFERPVAPANREDGCDAARLGGGKFGGGKRSA